METIDQPEEYHTNNDVVNTALTFSAQGAGPSPQLASSEADPFTMHTETIFSEFLSDLYMPHPPAEVTGDELSHGRQDSFASSMLWFLMGLIQ